MALITTQEQYNYLVTQILISQKDYFINVGKEYNFNIIFNLFIPWDWDKIFELFIDWDKRYTYIGQPDYKFRIDKFVKKFIKKYMPYSSNYCDFRCIIKENS
jgi:hypothetical protein